MAKRPSSSTIKKPVKEVLSVATSRSSGTPMSRMTCTNADFLASLREVRTAGGIGNRTI